MEYNINDIERIDRLLSERGKIFFFNDKNGNSNVRIYQHITKRLMISLPFPVILCLKMSFLTKNQTSIFFRGSMTIWNNIKRLL